jgi:hypothetical protein
MGIRFMHGVSKQGDVEETAIWEKEFTRRMGISALPLALPYLVVRMRTGNFKGNEFPNF